MWTILDEKTVPDEEIVKRACKTALVNMKCLMSWFLPLAVSVAHKIMSEAITAQIDGGRGWQVMRTIINVTQLVVLCIKSACVPRNLSGEPCNERVLPTAHHMRQHTIQFLLHYTGLKNLYLMSLLDLRTKIIDEPRSNRVKKLNIWYPVLVFVAWVVFLSAFIRTSCGKWMTCILSSDNSL